MMTRTELLEAAMTGYQVKMNEFKACLAKIENELRGESPVEVTSQRPAPRKRKMSAAGRKAIAEAQRKRWAKARARK
jgi:hypothetical protein